MRYHERQIDDKIFHYARTCENKQEAQKLACKFRKEGYKIRIIKDKTYFDIEWRIYTYPKERLK